MQIQILDNNVARPMTVALDSRLSLEGLSSSAGNYEPQGYRIGKPRPTKNNFFIHKKNQKGYEHF